MADPHTLSRLLVWFSPAFPIGSFSFSHGLEWAVETGDVHDRASLAAWLEWLVDDGSGWSDAALITTVHRVAARGACVRVMRRLNRLADLGMALQPSRERRLETAMQGRAFLNAVETGWPSPLGQALALNDREMPLPVAVGAMAATHGLPLESALVAYLTGFCSNLVSAAIRLAPIGQSDGLAVMRQLEEPITRTARRALARQAGRLGTGAFRSDVASMRHETQVTRLFRS
jgi:urease accessory protein